MEQPAVPKPFVHAQTSIRSFFQPRQPNYTPPPSSTIPNITGVGGSLSARASPPRPSASPKQAEPEANLLEPRPGTASRLPATISPIHEKHVKQLKYINSNLLPIAYPDSFYKSIVDPKNSPNFSRVVLWHEPLHSKSDFSSRSEPIVVGGIVCRFEQDEISRTSAVYIQSLALLSPYRSMGLATRLLLDIVQGVVNTPQIEYSVTSLYAHVWTENTEGLEWYTARGFTREEPVVQGYYRRLQPRTAWIMRRSLVPSDHLTHSKYSTERAPSHTSIVTSELPKLTANSAPSGTGSTGVTSLPPRNGPVPAPITRASSYQNAGPGHEWNDLPDEILSGSKKPQTPDPPGRAISASHLAPNASASATGSAASSRSSSRSGVKKKRQYPAAAFSDTVNMPESSDKV